MPKNFRNTPQVNGKVPRYSHAELAIDHRGFHAQIHTNGRVEINNAGVTKDGEEYDEINIPAGLIFKLAELLTLTRKVEWIDPPVAGDKDQISE